jgi:ADP-ribose pyrophosphatase YjhB (NUDIX family)
MSDDIEKTHLTPGRIRFCPLCGHGLERRAVPPDGRPEMVCTGCDFIYYLSPKVVAGTVPVEDGRILLTRRAIHPSHGKWTFPGGYVDWGEPVDVAAIRETYEETGLIVEPGEIIGLYTRLEAAVVTIAFESKVVGGTAAPTREALEIAAFTPEEIPWNGLAFRTTMWMLRDWIDQRRPDVAWPAGDLGA